MAETAIQFDEARIRSNVPDALRDRPQWVCWRVVERGGKPTKMPVCAFTGEAASSTDPQSWVTFDDALAACSRDTQLAGIGFVFSADDPFAGVDLDHCIDPETGDIKAWARVILNDFDSYCETSPSGTGVKIFVCAAKKGGRCKSAYEDGGVEMYSQERFFTVTGARLAEYPAEVAERQEQFDALYAKVFAKPKKQSASSSIPPAGHAPSLTDDEIIEIACHNPKTGAKFGALWSGHWDGTYASASEADSALVFRLAFYTKDATQIDRLFRQSGLMRDKWDERRGTQTYGETTIERALTEVTDQYKPGKRSSNKKRKDRSPAKQGGRPAPGTIDPATGRLILETARTLPTAEAFVTQYWMHPGGMTLRNYAGQLLGWKHNRYSEIEDAAICKQLLPWLHAAVRIEYDSDEQRWVGKDFPANPSTMKAALESVKAHTHLPGRTDSPCWLKRRANQPDAHEILACRSTLLHLPTQQQIEPTPLFFNVNALDFDHDPEAPEPTQWQMFLSQLFEDDLRSWDLLQEWFGYCLTGDTSQHKMLLIVGPKRSGKGTIARVLRQLVGVGNVCGPTTSSLAGNFGLQPLLGKSVAIISDARFSGDNIQTVVERLLCITGEDTLTIDRKHLPSVTVKLPTRFVLLTNELPRLSDSSGALAGRFVMLRLTESFYGREDMSLTDKLIAELPGILNWSIEGWRQLRERGYFIQPASVEDALRELEDLASPVGAFVRDWCVVEPDLRIGTSELYAAWQRWCAADGRIKTMTKQLFGRNLMAVVPHVRTRCGTDSVRFYDGIALKGPPS